jgi:hypothetical protein
MTSQAIRGIVLDTIQSLGRTPARSDLNDVVGRQAR